MLELKDPSFDASMSFVFRGKPAVIRLQISKDKKEARLLAKESERWEDGDGLGSFEFLSAVHKSLQKDAISHKAPINSDNGKVEIISCPLNALIAALGKDTNWIN